MEIDWFSVGSFGAAAVAIVKGFLASHQANKANASLDVAAKQNEAYERRRHEEDVRLQERVRVLEDNHAKDVERLERELKKGDDTFRDISRQLNEAKDMFRDSIQATNSKLDTLIGFFDGVNLNGRTLNRK